MSAERENGLPAGCCTEGAPASPESVHNAPGQSALQYRVGTYASFLEAMFAAAAKKPALDGWSAREPEDFGVALLHLGAHVGDVLTFYQERIANEVFLRTAVLRESVLRISALLGYVPSPGGAATAVLAFSMDKGKELDLPAGLLVESVPRPGEKAQKFETEAAIRATYRLNAVPIVPVPVDPIAFIKKDASSVPLKPGVTAASVKLAPGQPFVLFDVKKADAGVEDKVVVAVHTQGPAAELAFSPAVQKNDGWDNNAKAYRYKRKLRAFGADAQPTYTYTVTATTSPADVAAGKETVAWNILPQQPSPQKTGANGVVALDGRYDDIAVGATILLVVHDPSAPRVELCLVTNVTSKQASQAPFMVLTSLTLKPSSAAAAEFDARYAVLYELTGDALPIWEKRFSETIPAKASKVLAAAADVDTSILVPDRTVILDDDSGPGWVTAIKAVRQKRLDLKMYVEIDLAGKCPRDMNVPAAVLRGNVVRATHGEPVAGEVLGDGDASAVFQRFSLRRSPVTFVPDRDADRGARNTLEVRVDGVRWSEVPDFFGQQGEAQVYTTRMDDSGVMTVCFGDGKTGSRLTTGHRNVVATYRQGIGRAGNVDRGAITSLLTRPAGLKAVINPVAAEGGTDPERLEQARSNAPSTVRTFGRIVSLQDFEDTARQFLGIRKARAIFVQHGEEPCVELTVAGENGGVGDELLRQLVAYLDARRDPHRPLRVMSAVAVPLRIEAKLQVDEAYVASAVQVAAKAALAAYFSFERARLGYAVALGEVYRALHATPGVAAVDVTYLGAKKTEQIGKLDENHNLHVDAATEPRGIFRIEPKEIAFVTADGDVTVTLGTIAPRAAGG